MHSAGGKGLDDASHFPSLVIYYGWFQHHSPAPQNRASVKVRESVPLFPPGAWPALLLPHLWSIVFPYLPFIHIVLLIRLSLLLFSFFFSTQLPFGEGLFHFYPQDTSKRRSKRSARSRQRLQKDSRVSIHGEMHTERSRLCVSCTHVPREAWLPILFAWQWLFWVQYPRRIQRKIRAVTLII